MARRTFFSFNYEEDVWRAGVVRKSGALNDEDVEFIDGSLWEKAKTQGDDAIKKLIAGALDRSSVTAVLIGANTASRRWVKYEIDESIRLGKGLFGVHIYKIKDQNQKESTQGTNPLPSKYKVYLWVKDKGAENLGKWGEAAYQQAHPSGS
jgi:antiphage defense system Thoeris ThsB-like protein